MSAYAGGRAEAHLRRVEAPVVYLDVVSEFPTVATLASLWRWWVAERLDEADATEEARALLAGFSPEQSFKPTFWPRIAGVFCRVDPAGAVLPVRSRYALLADRRAAAAWQIGLPFLEQSVEPLWYALPDVLASLLLGGPTPQIVEAFRVAPVGMQPGLCPVALRGQIRIDPAGEDFFRRVIEERKRVSVDPSLPLVERDRLQRFAKVVANSTSYGIGAEMRVEAPIAHGLMVDIFGLAQFACRVRRPERPGKYCFPPLAATVTALARLFLALLQWAVERRGGTYLACDTDSLIVVASRDGGPVPALEGTDRRALSWAEVDEVRDRLNGLNPYDRSAVPDIIKLEDENFAQRADGTVDRGCRVQLYGYAISAKRFALYEHGPDGASVLRKRSEHGLGALLSPLDPDADHDVNRPGSDGGSIALQEDGVHDRVQESAPVPEAVSA